MKNQKWATSFPNLCRKFTVEWAEQHTRFLASHRIALLGFAFDCKCKKWNVLSVSVWLILIIEKNVFIYFVCSFFVCSLILRITLRNSNSKSSGFQMGNVATEVGCKNFIVICDWSTRIIECLRIVSVDLSVLISLQWRRQRRQQQICICVVLRRAVSYHYDTHTYTCVVLCCNNIENGMKPVE